MHICHIRFGGWAHRTRFSFVVLSVALLSLIPVLGAGADSTDPTQPPIADVLNVDSYDLTDTPTDPVLLPDYPKKASLLLWGYEASFGASRILSYNIATGAQGPWCVPDLSLPDGTPEAPGNGRGVAYDPKDDNLWITRLDGFFGDGYIHKVTPPQVPSMIPNVCPQVKVIPFADGPGGTVQDDIGALDVDHESKHIWAAGYAPVNVLGDMRNYFYLLKSKDGKLIRSCYIEANTLNGLGFNDSLTYGRLKGLPGSGKYLLTDAGGDFAGVPLDVIDADTCHKGQQATIVATFNLTHGVSGVDFEWPGLLGTDLFQLYNDGNQPFASSTVIGPTDTLLEDISLCGFKGKFGKDDEDTCPYANP